MVEVSNAPDEVQEGTPLFNTFWDGTSPAVCNATSYELTATEEKNYHYADKILIEERSAADYEACHWIISVDTDLYRDDTSAFIEMRFETLENAVAHIYLGTDRSNATTFIEGDQEAPLGAPFRAPISSPLIVVTETTPYSDTAGKVAFSYQLFDAQEYAWFFKPFVGVDKAAWYFFVAGVFLTPLIILIITCLCCCYLRCCRRCCLCCCDCDYSDSNQKSASSSSPQKKINRVEIGSKNNTNDLKSKPSANSQDVVHDSESDLRM